MEAKEIRDLEDRELAKQIATLRKDLFGLRFANATGELEDTAGIGRAKRDLARALTVARERQLAGKDLSAGSVRPRARTAEVDTSETETQAQHD
jgi:large subunit ribosomal protein L29